MLERPDTGDFEKAEQLYHDAIDGFRESGEEGFTRGTMNELAWFLKDHGPEKLADAEDLADGLVDSYEQEGRHDEAALNAADTLGVILMMQERFVAAEELFGRLVETARKELGRHRLVLLLRARHGACLVELDDYEVAEELLEQTYSRMHDVLAAGDEDTIFALESLIALYDAWEKPQKASHYRQLLDEALAAP